MEEITLFVLAASAAIYVFTAAVDHLHHRSLKAHPNRVTRSESVTHVLAVGCILFTFALLLFPQSAIELGLDRQRWLFLSPVALFVVGVVDELMFHRIRCATDPKENWYHAVAHFFLAVCLLSSYARWYEWP